MRINELIVESQQIDELSLAGALGSAAKGAANVVGGAKGAWAGAKDVYNQQAGRVANVAQRNVQRAGGYKAPQPTPATARYSPNRHYTCYCSCCTRRQVRDSSRSSGN